MFKIGLRDYYNEPEQSEEVILMLQKFEDVQKNKEKEYYTKMKQMAFLNMSQIHQLMKNKTKIIIMRFKINVKKNNQNKQKNQKKLRKVLQNE